VQPFAKYAASLDYLTGFPGNKSYLIGGETSNLFWHVPKYAIAEFCPVDPNLPAGAVPVCDPLQNHSFAVLAYDYGSLRQPVIFQFWIPSVLLFGLAILALHWYETDERKKKQASLAPVPVTTASD
jgi:hypothetical protein